MSTQTLLVVIFQLMFMISSKSVGRSDEVQASVRNTLFRFFFFFSFLISFCWLSRRKEKASFMYGYVDNSLVLLVVQQSCITFVKLVHFLINPCQLVADVIYDFFFSFHISI